MSPRKKLDIKQDVTELVNWLAQRGLKVFIDNDLVNFLQLNNLGGFNSIAADQLAKQIDLLIVLGGDRTLLGAARLPDIHYLPADRLFFQAQKF